MSGGLESTREIHTSRMGRVSNYLITRNVRKSSRTILPNSNASNLSPFSVPRNTISHLSEKLKYARRTGNIFIFPRLYLEACHFVTNPSQLCVLKTQNLNQYCHTSSLADLHHGKHGNVAKSRTCANDRISKVEQQTQPENMFSQKLCKHVRI